MKTATFKQVALDGAHLLQTPLYQHDDYFHKLQVGGTVSFQQVTRNSRNDFRSATAVTASRIPYRGLVGLCLLHEKC